ncbi:hypothetical protein GMRT_13389 [Giardia muris]|uniref:SWIM-type domain-containing protein n=1 Tax=Giardia muris TaxID=5742 RepID=A0A4Z1SL39_GIAMU|nr:hypothetical protein GMRT_13389 [Giardia muris]|eukprot:TNJ26356.1 hypothetical protein GMRT_13389 [Giardia muris]
MEALERLLLQRVRSAHALTADAVADLRCFYGPELELAMATLDRPNLVGRYVPDPTLHGMPFYVVKDLETGARNLVIVQARFCGCEKHEACGTCRHLLAVYLIEALELPVQEANDHLTWEGVLMELLEKLCA